MSRPGTLERERKLAGWAGFELPDLTDVRPGVLAVPMADQQLEATYYDTADLQLARNGISARFRTGEGPKGKWTVKLPEGPSGPTLLRREIDVEAPGRTVPAAVTSLVRAHVRRSTLAPVGTLQTVRRRVELRDGDGRKLAEVADDEVSVLEGRRVALRFRELEVEVVLGVEEGLLDAVVARLESAGARAADQTPKIVRALGPRALDPPDLVVAALDPDEATLRDVVGAAITTAFRRLVEHDPGVRLGGDPEDVHQARVAARRLRSDLRTFRDVVEPGRGGALRDELRWAGGVLGVVRDADVLLDRLRHQVATLPAVDARAGTALVRRLQQERAVGRSALLEAFDSDRYLALLDDLAAAALDPPTTDEAATPARKALPGTVRGPWKHLQKAVEALDDHPEDDVLHDLRIRAKRTRYAAEAAAPVLGKPAARFAKAVAGLQTVLGDLQDAVVAEAWLRAAGAKGPASQALVIGQLLVLEREAMAEARRDWPAAWDEVAGKKLRTWLS